MCVFKLLAAWPAAELLPSYGVALAPHVLIFVAKIKPWKFRNRFDCVRTNTSRDTGADVSHTRYVPQSPSGYLLPGPTSTPFDNCRGNPRNTLTLGYLEHSGIIAGGIDESLFKAQRCALIIEHQQYLLQFGF
ncbi:hypothetical protein B0H14DRAFT_3874638 [Mycena olivaceomarginata]|nr:hypothetical protein B0H14DRAFT_3874638 [Mycena olivaceomarginata]